MEFDDEIREFLIESNENLARLDCEIVQLEQTPDDIAIISSAFRTIHTIKGTCGFFGYDILGSVTHVTENLLSQVRERQRVLTPELISLILEAVDEVKLLLECIETTGAEGEDRTGPLRARLEEAHRACPAPGGGETAVLTQTSPAVKTASSFKASPLKDSPFKEDQQSETAALPEAVSAAAATPMPSRTPAIPLNNESGNEPGERPDEDGGKDGIRDAHLAESTIRVDVGLLNRLMNLVGELVLARNQLLQDSSALNPALQQTSQRLNLITSELQEGVMKTRMQPIGVVWNKLPRVVRDLAAKCGKRVQLEMDGAGTELDKTIIEAIKDPLTHIVRNSCDHGIEMPDIRRAKGKSAEGMLLLRAYHEGGVVNIEISDDGAGIDPERVKAKAIEKGLLRSEQAAQMSARDAIHIIFMPGFSTAAAVTSISGRGVGMDVVKTNIEKIGGSVEVLNREECGTTIRIKIPLTLAIIPGLVVTLEHQSREQVEQTSGPRWRRQERFIIPQANLLELVRIEGAEVAKRIESVHGTPVYHHRGKLLPLIYLGRVLGRAESSETCKVVNIIVLQAENRQLGLVVDRICDTQEIVVKPLGRQLKGLICYVGATIMGDGRPALILDVAGLARLAGLGAQARPVAQIAATVAVDAPQPQMMLLFRAGIYQRLAVPLALVDRLEEISATKIERAGGRAVLHYRGKILPLVSIGHAPGQSTAVEAGLLPSQATPTEAMTQIVVFSHGAQRIGLIVDQIIDIVNEPVTARRSSSAAGLLGSAVIGGRITDLLDLHTLVELSGDNWLAASLQAPVKRNKLVLFDDATVPREMIAAYLDACGYQVSQATTAAMAGAKIRQNSPHAILLAGSLPASESAALLQALRTDKSLETIPVMALLDRAEQGTTGAGYAAQVVRSNRPALLATIATLMQEPTASLEVRR